ncbi:hypothetical protein B7494_g7366 [Chlorociboria aeruginascens]|nr:hypothetical protein B7494_g7366 [Chlorociboria aeruginascens]
MTFRNGFHFYLHVTKSHLILAAKIGPAICVSNLAPTTFTSFPSSEQKVMQNYTMLTLTTDKMSAKALAEDIPMRIFYSPKACDFDRTNLANSIQQKLHDIVQSLSSGTPSQPAYRFLAAELWGRRIQIVFDVNHHKYEYETAHILAENNLPVFRLQSATNAASLIRDTDLDIRVNERIAQLHNLNGTKARPPYIADHTQGADPVVYLAPRVKNAADVIP